MMHCRETYLPVPLARVADSLLSLLSPTAGHRRKFVDEGKLRKVRPG